MKKSITEFKDRAKAALILTHFIVSASYFSAKQKVCHYIEKRNSDNVR